MRLLYCYYIILFVVTVDQTITEGTSPSRPINTVTRTSTYEPKDGHTQVPPQLAPKLRSSKQPLQESSREPRNTDIDNALGIS